MTDQPRGRADLHIHTLASDGVSSVAQVLDAAELAGLGVIAITDHDRIEAAIAAQALAMARGSSSKSSWAKRSPPAAGMWWRCSSSSAFGRGIPA